MKKGLTLPAANTTMELMAPHYNYTAAAATPSFFSRSKSEGDLQLQHSSSRFKENTLAAAAAAKVNSTGDELIITIGTTTQSADQTTMISAVDDDHVIHHMPQHMNAPRDIGRGSAGTMKYLVFTLLGAVGIVYDGRPAVVRAEFPVQFWCFIAAVCTYWAIMKIPESNRNTVLNRIALACEVLAVISLLSVLFPDHVSLVFFVSSAAVSAVIVLTYIYWFRT